MSEFVRVSVEFIVYPSDGDHAPNNVRDCLDTLLNEDIWEQFGIDGWTVMGSTVTVGERGVW